MMMIQAPLLSKPIWTKIILQEQSDYFWNNHLGSMDEMEENQSGINHLEAIINRFNFRRSWRLKHKENDQIDNNWPQSRSRNAA